MPNSLASFFSAKNLAMYGTLSVAAAAAVVFNAFRERSNFYAATVMLSRSNGSMLILLNLGFFFAVVSSRISQLVFFGALRPVEVEHIYERCSFSIGESLIALTIFRDQFDVGFFAIFVELLFAKIFHWLCSDRVEYMEQSPSVSRLFHIRMCSLLWFLFVIDVVCVIFVVEYVAVQRERSGLVLLFASEYIILFANLLGTIAKYGISWYDLRREEPWEAKSMYIFYVDLVIDGIKFVTYAAFFSLILSYYGFPINMLQNLYLTGRQFVHRLRDLVRYRAATRNMNERYPDATHADMRTCDGVCIICRDEMRIDAVDPDAEPVPGAEGQAAPLPPPPPSRQRVVNETPKKLPCGHIFHFQCLRSWLERQQSCPTCRRTVLPTDAATGTAQTPAQPAPVQAPAAGPGPANPTPDAAAPAQPRAPPNPDAFPGAAARQERLATPTRPPISSTPRAAPRNEDVAPSANTTESSPQTQLLAFLKSLETRLHSDPGSSDRPRPPLPEEIVHAILADARDTAKDRQRLEDSSSQEESAWVLPHPDELKRTSSLVISPADAPSAPTASPAPMTPTPLSPREAARAAAIKRAEMLMGKKKGSDSKQDSVGSHRTTTSSVNSDPKLARVLGRVTLTRSQQAADRAEARKNTHLVPLFEVDASPEWATEQASLPYPIVAADRSPVPSMLRSREALRELGPQDQQVLDNSLAALAAAREEMRKAQAGIDAILETLSMRGTIATSQAGEASSDHRSEPGAGEARAGAATDKGKRPTEGIHAPAPDSHPSDDVF